MLKFYDSSLEDEKGELRPVSSIFIFDSQKKIGHQIIHDLKTIWDFDA